MTIQELINKLMLMPARDSEVAILASTGDTGMEKGYLIAGWVTDAEYDGNKCIIASCTFGNEKDAWDGVWEAVDRSGL